MAASRREGPRRPGRPQKLGDYRAFTVRIDAELYRQLRHYAVDKLPASFNDVIAEALAEWWRGRPERARYARLAAASKR